jgi:hypothetical protein
MLKGEYFSYRGLKLAGDNYLVPVVEELPSSKAIAELSGEVREWEMGREGVVVKMADGRMCKIKSDVYCHRHKAKDLIAFEKNVLKMILESTIDDIKPALDEFDLDRVNKYETSVLVNINKFKAEVSDTFNRIVSTIGENDRAKFAYIVKEYPFSGIYFAMYSGKQFNYNEFILKHCSSYTEVEKVRYIIGRSFLEF